MMGFLARMRGLAARDLAVDRSAVDGLGTSALAVRAPLPAGAPAAAAVLLEAADGAAWLVHALPLRCHVTPFAAAPELGLRIDFCFDASGDRSRFALLLAAEAEGLLAVDAVAAAIGGAVQGALQIGTLELPPCTTDEEWHAFRGGLNELVYARFGLVVEDCVPVDMHPAADLAAQLAANADTRDEAANGGTAHPAAPSATTTTTATDADSAAAAAAPAASGTDGLPPDVNGQSWLAWVRLSDLPLHGWRAAQGHAAREPGRAAASQDAAALRRLFLELPALAAGLRALPMQEGGAAFKPLQDILRRLALACVQVNTMPSLAHAAPGRRLPQNLQQLRAAHSLAAQCALDEGWALLASMRCGLDTARLDETDRMLSNLEFSLAQRRLSQP